MNKTDQSNGPDYLAADYMDPRMDRRLQDCMAEVRTASKLRRIAGVFLIFGMFALTACANEIGVHFRFGMASLCCFFVLAATWLWARRSWKTRYRIAAHICVGVEITMLWIFFIIFVGYQHANSVLYVGFIAAGAWLLLGIRDAIIWALVAVGVYALRFIPADAASRTFGPPPPSIISAALILGAMVAALWTIDRQYRTLAELAVVSDFEKNAAVRLNFQDRLAETGRKTATLGREIRPMLEELADIAQSATRFVGKLSEKEDSAVPIDFIDDLEIAWESIQRHSVRACSVVQTMTRSDIDQGSASGDELVDLCSLIQMQARVLESGLKVEGTTQVAIHTEVDGLASTLIAGQYSKLAAMLQSLITNAVDSVTEKAQRSGGDFQGIVQIRGRLLGGDAEIQVIDNGIGIDSNKIDVYFEPFYTTKPPTSGRAGLGLLTARATLVEIGGELTLAPETNNGGVVATATLPVTVSAAEPSNQQPAEPPSAATTALPKPEEISETDATLEIYRTDRYRVASVLSVLTLVVVGFGFADRQKIWIAILAILAAVSIVIWAWFESNPGTRFVVASRAVAYSYGLGAIAVAVTRTTVDLPLGEMLWNAFPPAVMLLVACAVSYGFAGLRLSLEVTVPVIIVFVAVVAHPPFTVVTQNPPPNLSLVAAGAVMEISGLVCVMLIPNTFSLALQHARRSRALLKESRETRLALSKVETAAALGRVSSGILHEVANPLNFIENFAKVVLDSFSDYDVDPATYRAEFDLFRAAERTHRLGMDINGRLDSLRLSVKNDGQPPTARVAELQLELSIE